MLELEREIERRIDNLCTRIDALDIGSIKMPCIYTPSGGERQYMWCAVHPCRKNCDDCFDFEPQPIHFNEQVKKQIQSSLKSIITSCGLLQARIRFLRMFFL